MREQDWKTADEIARSLQASQTDVNELKKVIAYLQWSLRQKRQPDLFEYLEVLVKAGEQRSNSTEPHYRNIQQACQQYLQEGIEAEVAIEILGWAARLEIYHNAK
ncbi:hypothetical protein ACKFKF_23490 [Phormidesmis sp. 146-12]